MERRLQTLPRTGYVVFAFVVFLLFADPPPVLSESIPHERWITTGVPFFPQEELGCGPAALSSLLTYWGHPVTLEEITREIELKELKGSLPLDLELAARNHGLSASSYAGSLEDLRSHLNKKQPVIAFLNLGWRIFPQGHFVVVTGYDDILSELVMHSGDVAYDRVPVDRFLNAWSKTGRWSLLILPKENSSSGS
jgi:ABC-type bacteriocin/lantibiotic exporter with double-glycine peptidase domain